MPVFVLGCAAVSIGLDCSENSVGVSGPCPEGPDSPAKAAEMSGPGSVSNG